MGEGLREVAEVLAARAEPFGPTTRVPEALELEIEDDGAGFDAPAYFRRPPASAGLGLLGMRERVAHFGGVFRVTSRPGAGTRLFVSVPMAPAASTVAAAS